MNIKRLASALLLCVFLAVVTTGCGEPCAARLAWVEVDKANVELSYFWEEGAANRGAANNFSIVEQHLENYKNYIAAAREIIQKAGSEYPELSESIRKNWSLVFQRTDVRANQATAALDLAKIGAQMPISEIMADPTVADIEDLKTITKGVRHFHAVQLKSLEELKVLLEQQFGCAPEDQCPNLKKEIAHVEKVVIGLQGELELLENELANRKTK